MLQKQPELQVAFGKKRIECIRVDGAGDEGPLHVEVQFWWTRRHFETPTHVTLVTTRNSGASYLNRVESQNGCLTVAHANLFIPSNLNGSCFDPSTGKVDQERLEANLSLATQIYIDRVNNAPCGTTNIRLYHHKKNKLSRPRNCKELTVKHEITFTFLSISVHKERCHFLAVRNIRNVLHSYRIPSMKYLMNNGVLLRKHSRNL